MRMKMKNHKLTLINLSLISHEKIPGFCLLSSSILLSTSGVATLGFEPPMTPGRIEPVSCFQKTIETLNKNRLDLDLYSLARVIYLDPDHWFESKNAPSTKRERRLFGQNRHRVNRSIDQMWKLYFSGSCAKWLTVVSFMCFFCWVRVFSFFGSDCHRNGDWRHCDHINEIYWRRLVLKVLWDKMNVFLEYFRLIWFDFGNDDWILIWAIWIESNFWKINKEICHISDKKNEPLLYNMNFLLLVHITF